MNEKEASTDEFVAKAESLRKEGKLQEALSACLSGLSSNPASLTGRLALARVFFELDYLPFARREIEEISREAKDSAALKSLAAKFGIQPGIAANSGAELVVSEADFEFDELDLVDDKGEGS